MEMADEVQESVIEGMFKTVLIEREVAKYLSSKDMCNLRLISKRFCKIGTASLRNFHFFNASCLGSSDVVNNGKNLKGVNSETLKKLFEPQYSFEVLCFSKFISEPITELPSSVTTILHFESSVDALCAQSLKRVVFGDHFNNCVDNLPNAITHLRFGTVFNRSIDKLPTSLTHLALGQNFCQKVDNLPKSLKKLDLSGYYFNKCVNFLPDSITDLRFGWSFNQKVDSLPKALSYLLFGCDFNQTVEYLPESLVYLRFGSSFNHPIDRLPNSIARIIFGHDFNKPVAKWPISLRSVEFGNNFNQSLEHLPTSVKWIKLGENFNHVPTLDHLPPSTFIVKPSPSADYTLHIRTPPSWKK